MPLTLTTRPADESRAAKLRDESVARCWRGVSIGKIHRWKSPNFAEKRKKSIIRPLMLTNKEAEELLEMPKWIVSGGNESDAARLPHREVSLHPAPRDENLPMASESGSHKFRLVINREATLKLALHHETRSGEAKLLRVEYGGKEHRNPRNVPSEKIPPRFHGHIGRVIDRGEPHIHRHVEGFGALKWALPLSADEFPVKSVSGEDDILKAVRAFGDAIAMKTEIHPAARC